MMEVQHIAWCHLNLTCCSSGVKVVSFRTQRPTRPQAWLSPPLPSHLCHVLQHFPMTHRRPTHKRKCIRCCHSWCCSNVLARFAVPSRQSTSTEVRSCTILVCMPPLQRNLRPVQPSIKRKRASAVGLSVLSARSIGWVSTNISIWHLEGTMVEARRHSLFAHLPFFMVNKSFGVHLDLGVANSHLGEFVGKGNIFKALPADR